MVDATSWIEILKWKRFADILTLIDGSILNKKSIIFNAIRTLIVIDTFLPISYVIPFLNRPFYSCLLGDLAFVWQRGWKWRCFDTDLAAFVVKMRLVSIRTT